MSLTKDIREYAENAIGQGRQVFGQALEQAQGYTRSAAELAEDWLETARKDPRLARVFDTAETVTARVVDTVQERVLAPVQATLAGRGTTPGTPPPAEPTAPRGPDTD